MASDLSQSMQYVLGNNEVEDFEVTEIDGALLRDLLEELENEEDNKNEKTGYVVQSPVAIDEPINMTDGPVSLEQHEICIPNSNWVDMDMVESDPSYEIEAWFADDMVGMVEFGCNVGDWPQLYNGGGTFNNEISYTCLWEE